ncbi:4'-phosphopantetheinyl transferase family protein [Parapedobacter indicus]|uniref:4'-phosphopantetheinyl transferase n=1 Tax=Parapedobacter indicus TaxID=1477437 RepID=A0A1I3QXR5_9SPHI|nr:4'-phosphopantetheinyl transferase superfamily protein [Parapedobacter indicus]PPL00276.1 4'-phosphopantetheinyl transferase [Parapedobacter indicus]SFJ38540.1 4'-phosphopantetheinyl transferase [Parapedobacter indicus]
MDHTLIISTWLPSIQWSDGWKAMKEGIDIQRPSLWVIDPKPFLNRLPKHDGQLLSDDETAKAERFHQTDHKLRFSAAHTALRLLLSYATVSDPSALRFEKGHHNKPKLVVPANTDIQFNLSYTENRAMIGLSSGQPIGVDIEWSQRPLDIETMVEACFSTNEIAFISAEKREVHRRFFTLWTRKEAILKLTGEGIGEHLPYFEVLDGVRHAEKRVIGGQPPDTVYLYSFSVTEGFIGCFASPTPITRCSFYRL